jgi:hypothetical protein
MGWGCRYFFVFRRKGLKSTERHGRTSDKSMISEDVTRKPEISLKEDGNEQ